MIRYESVTDLLLTGCAIAPALALYTEQPALALFSHVILLLLGIMFAAGDRNAPFRKAERAGRNRS